MPKCFQLEKTQRNNFNFVQTKMPYKNAKRLTPHCTFCKFWLSGTFCFSFKFFLVESTHSFVSPEDKHDQVF